MITRANKAQTILGHEYYEPVETKEAPYTHWILDEKAFKEIWKAKKDLEDALNQISEEQHENERLRADYNGLVEEYNELLQENNELKESYDEIEAIKRETEAVRQTKKHIIELCRERANKERKIKNKKEHPGYVILDSRLINYHCSGRETVEMWKTTMQTPFFVELSKEEFYDYFTDDDYRKEYFAKIGIGSYQNIQYKTKVNVTDKAGEYFIDMSLRRNVKSGFWEVDLIHYNEVIL